jgi:hypothetical protein
LLPTLVIAAHPVFAPYTSLRAACGAAIQKKRHCELQSSEAIRRKTTPRLCTIHVIASRDSGVAIQKNPASSLQFLDCFGHPPSQ